MKKSITFFLTSLSLLLAIHSFAQFVPIGNGGYTTSHPGVDEAGRNQYPSGTPQLSGNAAGKPVPTNDWWSKLIKENHADNLYNYPLAMRTTNEGLIVDYVVPSSGVNGSSQPMGPEKPVVVGVTGLNAPNATASDFSDWTVSMNWTNSTHNFTAMAGIAMPFLYFTKATDDVAQIEVNLGTVTINGEMLVITDSQQGADFAVYAPTGSTWTENSNVYTSTLNGQNYWSLAFLPPDASDVSAVANEYKKYAYVFPTNTTAEWNFDESTSKLTTTFTVTTDVKEGTESNVLLGLLPHQWGNLGTTSPQPNGYSYSSIRGEIKTLEGNTFTVENTFYGILPTLPYQAINSDSFDPAELHKKVQQLENEGLATWTDSYNQGQEMNRLIQTARIADQMGNTEARNKLITVIKERLEDWLKAEAGEVAFLFYYNSDWSAMIGYPAGHGQDGNLNDHHFHWGYFIHAAAFVEQFNPGWANQWGDMINLLVRDASSPDRNDTKFPFLRNFSPYAGHCWANGFATFPFGNDQESSSESMQFNSSLIHWGTITGNDEIRDLGIYLYTTEQTAAEEYWFDMNNRTFKDGYGYKLASRIWGNGYDNQTFWTSDIAAAYGIEMYPIHGGSLYLGHNTTYVQELWNEIENNTGILDNEANPNLWHDLMWEYLSFVDPQKAIDLYNSYSDRALKFGVSDAQTYHWIHAMNAMGQVNAAITADYPIAASFTNDGDITYVAHNYSNSPITVTFSDGYQLPVPANQMATSKDTEMSGIITTPFSEAYNNGSATFSVTVNGGTPTKVELFDGSNLVDTKTTAPFTFKADKLQAGIHNFYAKLYDGDLLSATNILAVQVGEQQPYSGTPAVIPGTIEAGHFDKYEGGVGQGIAYFDATPWNEGGFRPEEQVDAVSEFSEGATVGWLSSGEWLEYTVDIQTSGVYDMEFRYASGNTNGGGPFYIEIDGQKVSANITVDATSSENWTTWASKTISDIELTAGKHVLRVVITNGEFNLGKMTFNRTSGLSYVPPVADAGDNIKVLLPATTTDLDGSQSSAPAGETLTYEWTQLSGPTIITFDDNTAVSPSISNLEEGIYKIKLTAGYSTYTAQSEVLVIVTATDNLLPAVAITAPADNTSYYAGKAIEITASASDLDGTIAKVEFFDGATKLGESTASPYKITLIDATIGNHSITAVATDTDGASATSGPLTVIVTPAPSCSGEAENGDYAYEFSDEANNPTLTFIPLSGNAGVPTCILYIGTNPNSLGGFGVTPNTPVQITASEGEKVYFYYTYSYNGLEKNTADAKHSYVVGTCSSTGPGQNATLSEIRVNGNLIDGFAASTTSYTIGLPEGTTEVPTVTAITTDVNANFTSTVANAIPGTTSIVVTSADGNITKTYTVNFTISSGSVTAAPTPTQDAANVISLFSDTYTDVTVDTWSAVWDEADVADEAVSGNNMKFYTNLNYAGIECIANTIDISGMTHFHIDIWTPDVITAASEFKIKLVDFGADGAWSGGDDVEHELTFSASTNPALVKGSWISFDIPIADFTGMVTKEHFAQLIISATFSNVYVDNVYFYTEGNQQQSSDATLSDLTVSGTTITGFDAATTLYTFELAAGTTDVPTVTATPNDDNATVTSITDATALPGTTTVLITAEDGSTKTYEISFTVEQTSAISQWSDFDASVFAYQMVLNIQCDNELLDSKVDVFDVSGRRIVTKQINSTHTMIRLNVSGVYMVRIQPKGNMNYLIQKVLVY